MDVITGETLTQVAFGEQTKLTKESRSRIEASGGRVQSEFIASNVVVIAFPFRGVVPYRIGSVWELNVNEKTGEISLTEVKKSK
jgi:hypothetical protein